MKFFTRYWSKLKHKFEQYYWIFFHNDHTKSQNYIVDIVFEPVVNCTEKVAKRAGPLFVTLVIILTSSVVVNYYKYIYPWNYERWSPTWYTINFLVSLWLLVNIVFNYFMGVFTKPGKPPPKVENPASICKNCISPKPPRTHHCGICRECVLKMDHHCPWLNNCVGHYNHRFFYLFCLYMTLGTIFVSTSSYKQFRTYFPGSPLAFFSYILTTLYTVFSTKVSDADKVTVPSVLSESITTTPSPPDDLDYARRFWVTYEFFLCASVTVALGSLLCWHSYIISRGETSIEKHINEKEARRLAELGSQYRNPYDFGVIENWKVLFGIERGTGRSWLRVLFPSWHSPTGDGNIWRTVNSKTN